MNKFEYVKFEDLTEEKRKAVYDALVELDKLSEDFSEAALEASEKLANDIRSTIRVAVADNADEEEVTETEEASEEA